MTTQTEQNIAQITGALVTPTVLTLIDANAANVSYIATNDWGALTSDATWQVVKVTMNCAVTTSGSAISIGSVGTGTQSISSQPTQGSWDGRTSITYKY